MGREGRQTAKRRGARPWEGPGGSAAIATAASTTSKPRGRGSGRDDGTRLWSHNGAIAALEFSQPSLGRRRTGAWRPGSRGPSWAAGGRGGEAAPGPLGHQDSYTELEDRPGAASTGWGTAAVPAGATAGRPTLPEGRQGAAQHWEPSLPEGKPGQRGGRSLQALLGPWADSMRAGSTKIENPRAGAEDSVFSLPTRRAMPHHPCPRKDNPQEKREASFT